MQSTNNKLGRPPVSVTERFLKYIEKDKKSGCWLWKSTFTNHGQPQIWNGFVALDARYFSYRQFVGPVRKGAKLKRNCSERRCVNPNHYEIITILRGKGLKINTRKIEQFWKLVEKTSSCWLFRGTINADGYGKMFIKPRLRSAHHISYFLKFGELPSNKFQMHHKCEVKNCVNPKHLKVVTPREHVRLTLSSPPGENSNKTHCIRGHPLRGNNILWYPQYRRGKRLTRKKRECRTCRREQSQRFRDNNPIKARAYAREYYRNVVRPKELARRKGEK